jgi:hypothetical protein
VIFNAFEQARDRFALFQAAGARARAHFGRFRSYASVVPYSK